MDDQMTGRATADTLVIHDATIMTLGPDPRVLEDGAVLVEDGQVAEVGSSADLLTRHPHAEKLTARGGFLQNIRNGGNSQIRCGPPGGRPAAPRRSMEPPGFKFFPFPFCILH